MSSGETAAAAPAARPVVFGQEGNQLFGWYHAPAIQDGQDRNCIVVLCNPIGYDAICVYRHYRVLAQQLAAAGFSVLRYDHHGTGDSSGSDEDPERVLSWVNGVREAVDFGKQCSGTAHAALFGVRMGATLAIAAAAAAPLAESIIAWAAFPSGHRYLREMRALRMTRDANSKIAPLLHDASADLGEESAGYLLTTSTLDELENLDLYAIDSLTVRHALLLDRDDIPGGKKLAQHLLKLGCEVTQSETPGYAGMMKDTYDSVVPAEALGDIRKWLESRYPLRSGGEEIALPEAGARIEELRGWGANVVETPVFFGEDERLFGIVSEARRPQGKRGRTGVVFLTVGSNHHIGPNRMYVRQARAFASLGFTSLRMDIGGVGDSPAAPGCKDNQLYADYSVDDVGAAIRFLRERHKVDKVILIGVCSGGYLSYKTTIVDPNVTSMVLINLQTFSWKRGDPLQIDTIRSLSFYRRRMLSLDTWKRLARGEVDVGSIRNGLVGKIRRRVVRYFMDLWRARKAARKVLPGGASESSVPAAPVSQASVKSIFQDILARSVNIFLIYSINDGGLDEMERQLGWQASAFRRNKRFKLEIVDGADHTFTPLWAQRRLVDLLTQHLMRLYG